jgi:hypothetical protein
MAVMVVMAAAVVGALNLGLLDSLKSINCRIKGNVSRNGERIYHMPSDRYYGVTRINPNFNERWFCTEAEAQAAGWRRARR